MVLQVSDSRVFTILCNAFSSEQLMVYEPSEEFKTALEYLETLLNSTSSSLTTSTDISPFSSSSIDESTHHFECSSIITLVEKLWSVKTLFVSRGVLEVTGVLRRTVQNMQTAATQVQ